MNVVFFSMVVVAFLKTAWHQLRWIPAAGSVSPMERLSKAVVESAAGSVELALGLIGVMTLFLGLMKVAEAGGLLTILSRLIRPLTVRLFPDVPAEHPAMGAMILNFSANVMGLGNAATPFGIRAMQELEKLNPHRGTATDAMVLFIAINTASLTLLPTGVIALRAAAGSSNPAGILPTTLFATFCSTLLTILVTKAYQRLCPVPPARFPENPLQDPSADDPPSAPELAAPPPPPLASYPAWICVLALTAVIAVIPITVVWGKAISPWIVPALVTAFLGFGAARKVRIYEVFVEGARDGFEVAVKIIPYLVAILVAIGMLRASGVLDTVVGTLGTWTSRVGLPAEGLLMAMMRSLSGSGAYGVLASIINNPEIGPDSYTGYLVSTLQGSSETTFYVLAVYFGSVQVKRIRHALAAGLTGDVIAVVMSVFICWYLYG
ncbi:MAG: spore maturation protein [Deltaproteobacteria bacterium]|nr:spore maturation protein [Deltaproteobacteria bacterium]